MNKKTLITIYKSLVESIFKYGIIVWGGLYDNSLHKLNIVQKYILKVMFKRSKRYPTDLLFSVDVGNVRSLYLFEVCSYMYTWSQDSTTFCGSQIFYTSKQQ